MKKEIAKILKAKIKELGISKYSLCNGKDSIMSTPTLDNILSGHKGYNVDNLITLCKRLGIKELNLNFNTTTIKIH